MNMFSVDTQPFLRESLFLSVRFLPGLKLFRIQGVKAPKCMNGPHAFEPGCKPKRSNNSEEEGERRGYRVSLDEGGEISA